YTYRNFAFASAHSCKNHVFAGFPSSSIRNSGFSAIPYSQPFSPVLNSDHQERPGVPSPVEITIGGTRTMVEVIKKGAYLVDGQIVWAENAAGQESPDAAREKTIAYSILRKHDKSTDPKKMRLKFDALISHDITFVGIIQTAKASGLTKFPIPYAMTNCHNSLCAVGGTINEDDHAFGLSAAKKYGGIYVPPNQAVIHQYARERLAGCEIGRAHV